MTSSPLVDSTTNVNPTTIDADDTEASSIAPTTTANSKELSIKEDQDQEVITFVR